MLSERLWRVRGGVLEDVHNVNEVHFLIFVARFRYAFFCDEIATTGLADLALYLGMGWFCCECNLRRVWLPTGGSTSNTACLPWNSGRTAYSCFELSDVAAGD